MKAIVGIVECGECSYVMMVLDRPYEHLIACCNQHCPEFGVAYDRPAIELTPGKVFKTAQRA